MVEHVHTNPREGATGTQAPTSTNYILRVPTSQAARFAFAADNGKIWFILRPQKGSRAAVSPPVTESNFFQGR